MGNSFFIILNQINLSNSLTTKIYIKSPIFISWPYRYTLSLKCTTYSKLSILIMYYTSILPLPDLIQRTIFNLRQDGGIVHYKNREFRVSSAFKGQRVAIRPTNEDGRFDVYFCGQRIAQINLV